MARMIGFEAYSHQGPGIFLTRLQQSLEARGRFSAEEPDVWIQLSFHELPDWVRERQQAGKTKVMVRMDGCYCERHHKIRKPVVLRVPVLDDWYSAKVNRKKNALIRTNLLNTDHIIYQSEFSRAVSQKFVTPTPPGTIIYNGIDLETFSPEGAQHPIRLPDAINILVSHSFRPYHRLHDSFRILSRVLKQAEQPYHLHILGGDDGISFAYARSVADSLGLEEGLDYTFHGKFPHHELASVYRACDMMLNLSYWDSCPNVVIEALACGLPVVGVNYGGVAELVNPSGGILVDEEIPFIWLPHRDFERMPKAPIDSYATAVLTMSKQLEQAAQQARILAVKRFDIERVCDEYLLAASNMEVAREPTSFLRQ
jgi:glycosyltransferase involved in cell wall biosynthesis